MGEMNLRRLYEMPKDRPKDPDEVLVLCRIDEHDPLDAIVAVFADEEQLRGFLDEYFERYSADEDEDHVAKIESVLNGDDHYLGVKNVKFYVR